jgi:hypothetical protein
MTVWSLHLFNLVLCLLLFLATKERRRRLERQAAAWPHCGAGVRPVQGPSFGERVSSLRCRAEPTSGASYGPVTDRTPRSFCNR